jgi:hypothetical protein
LVFGGKVLGGENSGPDPLSAKIQFRGSRYAPLLTKSVGLQNSKSMRGGSVHAVVFVHRSDAEFTRRFEQDLLQVNRVPACTAGSVAR